MLKAFILPFLLLSSTTSDIFRAKKNWAIDSHRALLSINSSAIPDDTFSYIGPTEGVEEKVEVGEELVVLLDSYFSYKDGDEVSYSFSEVYSDNTGVLTENSAVSASSAYWLTFGKKGNASQVYHFLYGTPEEGEEGLYWIDVIAGDSLGNTNRMLLQITVDEGGFKVEDFFVNLRTFVGAVVLVGSCLIGCCGMGWNERRKRKQVVEKFLREGNVEKARREASLSFYNSCAFEKAIDKDSKSSEEKKSNALCSCKQEDCLECFRLSWTGILYYLNLLACGLSFNDDAFHKCVLNAGCCNRYFPRYISVCAACCCKMVFICTSNDGEFRRIRIKVEKDEFNAISMLLRKEKAIEVSEKTNIPVSRLYEWEILYLEENNEESMLVEDLLKVIKEKKSYQKKEKKAYLVLEDCISLSLKVSDLRRDAMDLGASNNERKQDQ